MWQTKTFRTAQALRNWIKRNGHRYQWEEIAVNNAWGVLYRPLRHINRQRRRNPAALRKAAHVYGKRWVVEGFPGYRRLYVHRTNVGSYVVSTSEQLSMDSMLEIDGNYHFGTLKQLKAALARAERTSNPGRGKLVPGPGSHRQRYWKTQLRHAMAELDEEMNSNDPDRQAIELLREYIAEVKRHISGKSRALEGRGIGKRRYYSGGRFEHRRKRNRTTRSKNPRFGWTVLRRRSYRHVASPVSWWPTQPQAEADARERQRRDPEGQEYVVRKATQQEADAASPFGRRRNFASGWRYIRNLPDNYPLATGSPNARRPNGRRQSILGTLVLKRVPTSDSTTLAHFPNTKKQDVIALAGGKEIARWPWYYSNKPRYGQKTVMLNGVRWPARWRK